MSLFLLIGCSNEEVKPTITNEDSEVTSIQKFDIEQYLGTWIDSDEDEYGARMDLEQGWIWFL